MGNEIARNDGQLHKQTVGTADPAGTAGTDKRNSNTAAARTPAAAGSGTPSGGTAGGTRTPEEKKSAGLAPVKPPEPVEGAAPAPATPQKQQRRKKPSQKKKTAPETGFNAEQISALLLSISAITASREGFEMFALTDVEAMQIATPLANMIQKSEQLSKISEYSDGVSLVTAGLVVMVPRLLLYFDNQKKKKIAQNGGVQLVRKESKSVGGHSGTSKPDTRPAENDVADADSPIPAFI